MKNIASEYWSSDERSFSSAASFDINEYQSNLSISTDFLTGTLSNENQLYQVKHSPSKKSTVKLHSTNHQSTPLPVDVKYEDKEWHQSLTQSQRFKIRSQKESTTLPNTTLSLSHYAPSKSSHIQSSGKCHTNIQDSSQQIVTNMQYTIPQPPYYTNTNSIFNQNEDKNYRSSIRLGYKTGLQSSFDPSVSYLEATANAHRQSRSSRRYESRIDTETSPYYCDCTNILRFDDISMINDLRENPRFTCRPVDTIEPVITQLPIPAVGNHSNTSTHSHHIETVVASETVHSSLNIHRIDNSLRSVLAQHKDESSIPASKINSSATITTYNINDKNNQSRSGIRCGYSTPPPSANSIDLMPVSISTFRDTSLIRRRLLPSSLPSYLSQLKSVDHAKVMSQQPLISDKSLQLLNCIV